MPTFLRHAVPRTVLCLVPLFIFNACNTVNVKPDGTFSPATLNIKAGDAVVWKGLTTTDAIVEIRDPGMSDPCDLANPALPHQVIDGALNEFSGPQRQAVSGIFSLGPDERGFVDKTEPAACACENPTLPPRDQCALVPTGSQKKLETAVSILDGNTHKFCPNEAAPHETNAITWANPDITGVTIRLDWSNLQQDIGGMIRFYFDDLEREMNAAVRSGKVFNLDIRAGNVGTPRWIFNNYSGPAGPGPIAPLPAFKDFANDPTGTDCGFDLRFMASPTDKRYRDLYVAMIREVAAEVESDARWYQALGMVKISGANFITSEARMPKRCLDDNNDGTLDTVNGDRCLCNTQQWADAGYTPAGLYEYYRVVGNEIYRDFFKKKSLGYQLIQEGFPRTISRTNFEGDTLTDTGGVTPLLTPPGITRDDIPPAKQTETILQEQREGRFTDPFGALRDNAEGKLFTPQHSGLQPLPEDQGEPGCSQAQLVGAGPPPQAAFPIPAGTPGDQNNDRDGDGIDDGGCPNKWAVDEGTVHTQIMGFQTNNAKGIASPAAVESSLWNMTINSNGVFIELYEQRLWEISNEFHTGIDVLDPGRPGLPASNPAPFSKTLSQWVAELHQRRRALIAPNNVHTGDPFPQSYTFTFSAPITVPETHFYVNPSKCALTANANRVGKIIISP